MDSDATVQEYSDTPNLIFRLSSQSESLGLADEMYCRQFHIIDYLSLVIHKHGVNKFRLLT
jgi:hypothetical protein